MAKAGYDPALALDFWRRMMAKDDQKPQAPQFMSTHPRDYTRIQAMKDFLPEAEKHFVPQSSGANPPPQASPPPPPEASPKPDDLQLKRMDNRSQPGPPSGQWVPIPKK